MQPVFQPQKSFVQPVAVLPLYISSGKQCGDVHYRARCRRQRQPARVRAAFKWNHTQEGFVGTKPRTYQIIVGIYCRNGYREHDRRHDKAEFVGRKRYDEQTHKARHGKRHARHGHHVSFACRGENAVHAERIDYRHGKNKRERRGQRGFEHVAHKIARNAPRVALLHGERERRHAYYEKFQQKQLFRAYRIADGGVDESCDGKGESEHHDRDVLHNVQRGHLFDIAYNRPALVDYGGQSAEIVIRKYYARYIARHFVRRTEGDGAVALAQRLYVVHAVAYHSHRSALSLQTAHYVAFLVGRYPAENHAFFRLFFQLFFGKSAAVHPLIRIEHARFGGYVGYRFGIVAGNYLHVHVVFVEPFERAAHVRSQAVFQNEYVQRHGFFGHGFGYGTVELRQKHAPPAQLGLPGKIFFRFFRKHGHVFGRAQKIGLAPFQRHRAVFSRGRKRKRVGKFQNIAALELPVQSARRGFFILGCLRESTHQIAQVHRGFGKSFNIHDFKVAAGYRARLVKQKRVHARKHLHAVQILRKRGVLGKPEHGNGKRGGHHHEHTHGNHADYAGRNRYYGILPAVPVVHLRRQPFRYDKYHRQHGENYGRNLYEVVYGIEYARFGTFDLARGAGNAFYITILAHSVRTRHSLPFHNYTAGVNAFSRRALYGYGFARKNGFVHLHIAVRDNAVHGHLRARFRYIDVVEHEFFRGDFLLLPVADDRAGGFYGKRKFFNRLFRLYLLHYSYNHTYDNYGRGKRIVRRAYAHEQKH